MSHLSHHVERGRLIRQIRALELRTELHMTRHDVEQLCSLREELTDHERKMVAERDAARWVLTYKQPDGTEGQQTFDFEWKAQDARAALETLGWEARVKSTQQMVREVIAA